MGNPKVAELARLVGRSVGAASLKLANFSRFDPALQARGIRGMPKGSKGEKEVWQEFASNSEALAYESQRILAQRLGRTVEEVAEIEARDLPPEGLEREATVRVRVNQSFFRRRIISAYGFRCCVTGLAVPELLVASHIVPWAQDAANRLNPRNGLCLNALHDRAFDRGLMWVDERFIVHFSERLCDAPKRAASATAWLTRFDGHPLLLPKRFSPDPDLLRRHALQTMRSMKHPSESLQDERT